MKKSYSPNVALPKRQLRTNIPFWNGLLILVFLLSGFNNANTPIFGSCEEAFTLYQNQPNPFQEETVIGFYLAKEGSATLSIHEVSGKILKVIEGDYGKGYNEVSVARSDLAASGVLYYQLYTEEHSATMKMIIME